MEFVVRHRLDAAASLCVGSGSLDRTFAERVGFAYRDRDDFFGPSR